MGLEKIISKDVWEVINDNFEKGSYTTAVTNLMLYANDVIREKSGLNLDNTKLMDEAFLGHNPKLKVNKVQTQTEKDIQAGVGYLMKGLCLAIRNPRAHERYNDKKETAEKIILFIDYILEFIRNAKQPSLIEDWIKIIFDENFNSTQNYAKVVFERIPRNKRYDLLVNIFRNREQAQENQLNNIINELIGALEPEELIEFLGCLNEELCYCADDNKLRMFFSLFPPSMWKSLEPLATLKIENMIKKSLKQAKMVNISREIEYSCNEPGSLSTWAVNFIEHFETKEEIYIILGDKLASNYADERNFVIRFFENIIYDLNLIRGFNSLKRGIKKSLVLYDKETYDYIDRYILNQEEDAYEMFNKEYEIAKNYFEIENALPF